MELGQVTSVKNGQKQIEYLNSIIYTLEELKSLYDENKRFEDDIKDVDSQIEYCEDLKQEISSKMQPYINESIKKERDEEEGNEIAWHRERI